MASQDLTAPSQAIRQQLAKLRDAHAKIATNARKITDISVDLHFLTTAENCIVEIECLLSNIKPDNQLLAFDEKRRRLAEEVFGITEVFEDILLSGLSLRDLLNAQQVNGTFFRAIAGSSKLLQLMGLQPDRDAYYTTNLDREHQARETFPRFSVSLFQYPNFGCTQLRVCFLGRDFKLPKIGLRARSILICQPPVDYVTASLSCCKNTCGFYNEDDDHGGITVGVLLDAAAELKQEHRMCGRASETWRNGEGNSDVVVRFDADLDVRGDDEVLLGHHLRVESDEVERDEGKKAIVEEATKREAELLDYWKAKRKGWLCKFAF